MWAKPVQAIAIARRRLRRRWLIIGGGVATAAAMVLCALLVAYPAMGRRAVRSKLAEVASRLGQRIDVASIEVGLGRAVLRGVALTTADQSPTATVDTVTIDFDAIASLFGRARPSAVTIDGVHLEWVRAADGTDNLRGLAERWRQPGRQGTSQSSGADAITVAIRGITARAQDLASGTTATLGGGTVQANTKGRIRAELTDVKVVSGAGPEARVAAIIIEREPGGAPTFRLEGGQVAPWAKLALTGIKGSITAVAASDAFELDLSGGYGGVEETLWTAKGKVIPKERSGALDITADQFSLDRLAPILRQSSVVDYANTSVDAALHVEFSNAAARFAGGFHLRNLTVGHPMLADKPVQDVNIEGQLAGGYDVAGRVLTLDRGDFVSRGLPLSITGQVGLRGGFAHGGIRREKPQVTARLVVPPVPCQDVIAAFPDELIPYLQGYRLKGKFATDVKLLIDWTNLEATVLDGSVGIHGCRVTEEPADGLSRLQQEFEHFVEVEKDNWISFVIGSSNPDFVPIADVSPYLLRSLLTTEDSAFYSHRGFIVREFRTALVRNLEAGYFRYGASSITMQLVKNVVLYREKTLARKLQELFLTWYIEKVLDKDRILEIYVNAIEYGPGLYGIGPAARHYFAKHPRDLTPVEAAFFSSILPAPKQRYRQYCEGTLSRWTTDKISRILGLMHKRGRLTDEEWATASVTPLLFARDPGESEKQCMDRRLRAIKMARPTNPMKK